MSSSLLTIHDLSVAVADVTLLHHINLVIKPGAIHWLIGPNGSGKSSLARAIMGHPRFRITSGSLHYAGTDITMMPACERARLGIFLTLQQPVDIPGVSVYTLLKEAHRARVGTLFSMTTFDLYITKAARALAIALPLLQRPLQGFSGGQKKKLELLQLLVLQPNLIILDELDAGLDVDAIAVAGKALVAFRAEHPETSFLIISHDQRLAEYLPAETVHVIKKGMLTESGDATVLARVTKKGFNAEL